MCITAEVNSGFEDFGCTNVSSKLNLKLKKIKLVIARFEPGSCR